MLLGRLAKALGGVLALALLLGLLLFAFEMSLPAAPSDPESDGPDGPVTPDGKDPAEEEPEEPQEKKRRWPSRRSVLSWCILVAVVVGAIVGSPRMMGWALDTPNPIATVSGSSMWPTLKKGDLVAIKGVDSIDDLQVGDIIAFRHQNGLAVHRIVRIQGEVITTKGDANVEEDPPIFIEQVIGKIPSVAGRLVKIPIAGYLSILLGPVAKHATDVLGDDVDDEDVLRDGRVRPVEEYVGPGDRTDIPSGTTSEGKVIGTVEDMAQAEAGTSSATEGASLGPVPEFAAEEGGDSSGEPRGAVEPVEDLSQ